MRDDHHDYLVILYKACTWNSILFPLLVLMSLSCQESPAYLTCRFDLPPVLLSNYVSSASPISMLLFVTKSAVKLLPKPSLAGLLCSSFFYSQPDTSAFNTTHSCFQPFIVLLLLSIFHGLSINVSCNKLSYSPKSG